MFDTGLGTTIDRFLQSTIKTLILILQRRVKRRMNGNFVDFPRIFSKIAQVCSIKHNL